MKLCKLKEHLLPCLKTCQYKTISEVIETEQIITNMYNKFCDFANRFESLTNDELSHFVFFFYSVIKYDVAKVHCEQNGLDYFKERDRALSNHDLIKYIRQENTKQEVLEDLQIIKQKYLTDMQFLKEQRRIINDQKSL